MEKVNLVLVDDHLLFRKSLCTLINTVSRSLHCRQGFSSGTQLLQWLESGGLADIAIIDIDMKDMNGFELAQKLQTQFPKLPVLALSMLDDEISIIRMLRAGVKGYLTKSVDIPDIELAVMDIIHKGFHFSEFVTGGVVKALSGAEAEYPILKITAREAEFLKWSCSELTYKEIADKMHVSVKSVDAYRASLFECFGVKSRVGLALYAIKYHFV